MIKYLHISLIFIFAFVGTASAQKSKHKAKRKSKKIEVVDTTPKNGATNVSTTPFLSVEFNQLIEKGEGSIYIYNSYEDIVAEIDVNEEDVEIDDNELIIYLNTELEPNEDYYIEIDKKTVVGLKGNYFKGITSSKKWHFSTYISNQQNNNDWEEVTPAFYPNPARSTIHLKGQKNVEEVQIINLTGKLVLKDESKNSSININSLPQGMYIISFLQKSGNRVSKKLIKK